MMGNGKKGKVYLVGAGPGRADLITIRGAEVLKSADCIICDKLVNPFLLNYAAGSAEIINVPKRVGDGSVTQEEINRMLVEKAAGGKVVVRLKGGDPCIFGRGSEEAAVLADAGIDFEIVPGVTAGVAAAEYAGIMLTNRSYSSQVVFVTGREASGKQESNIDWRWLAKFGGTIVFYMAMESLDFIAGELIKNGMDEKMPAAVIADATTANQKTVKTSLGELSEKCKREKIGPPAIIVIGAAARGNAKLEWFVKRPLFGKNIVVTRDKRGNIDFAAKIISEGGNPVEFPVIKVKPLTETNEFLKVLAKFAEFDWIIFSSANGVMVFFDALQGLGKDGRVFGSAKVAAIGSETAAKLCEFGIKADFVPNDFTGRELGKELIGFTNLKDKRVLLLRSQIASDELVEVLEEGGAEVINAAIYTVVTEKNEQKRLREKITAGEIDWVTFASSSSVRGFFEQIPTEVVNSSGVKIASIGPVTSEELRRLGVRVDVEAAEHTIDGLLGGIKRVYE